MLLNKSHRFDARCSCISGNPQASHEDTGDVSVKNYTSNIYACRQREKEKITIPIIKAKIPTPIIPGSLASPSILAYTMDQKYTNSLPLYRQEEMFSRLGVDLSRQTMTNWMLAATDPWLKIINDRMHEEFLKKRHSTC